MKLVALGEILIDFLQVDDVGGLPSFVAQPGGAPANILCAAAKLGVKGAFIGKVGADRFGEQLKATLREHAVHTQGLMTSNEYPTTLAFVHINQEGDRSFSFYREGCADTKLMKEEVDPILLQACKIFHCGSNSLTSSESAEATMFAVKLAKENGASISFDLNVRENLWQDPNAIGPAIKQVLPYVDVLKVSEEEMELLTEQQDVEQGINMLANTYPLQLIVVTLGGNGALYHYKNETTWITGHTVQTVDTTGAGDSFVGAMLAGFIQANAEITQVSRQTLHDILTFANAAAAISTTKNGAIPSLPERQEIEQFLKDLS